MARTDWKRLAAPQEDGYDANVVLKHLSTVSRYKDKPLETPAGSPVWAHGRARWITAMDKKLMPSEEYTILPAEDEVAQEGIAVLDLWPAARDLSAALLVGICPLTTEARMATRRTGHGCSCGHFGDSFGCIYGTADDAWGFAESIVHEMAHWKLRALGVWFEEWTDFLLDNAADELYASPVRKDKTRPMGAVLHAQYSYIHVARMVTLALQAKAIPHQQDIDWAALQLSRITEGQGTLRENGRGTKKVGAAFLEGVDEWTTQVLTEGHAIVAAAQTKGAS